MYNGMYGGYGMGGGMGGGGSSSMMMSSGMMASVCMSAVAAGLYLMTNKPTTAPPIAEEVATSATTTASSGAAAAAGGYLSGLDGAYTLMVGSIYLTAPGKCGDTRLLFKSTNDNRTTWKVRKAWTAPNGAEAYTLQSDLRTFNKVCAKTYLTAPPGCRGPPFLSAATKPSLSQLWVFRGSSSGAVEIQNAECMVGRYSRQFLMNAGQVSKGKTVPPTFDARGGSTFSLMAPMG